MIYLHKSELNHPKFGPSFHMISDKLNDPALDQKAVEIGLKLKWKQKPGRAEEHFDLMGQFIKKAIAKGIEVIDTKRLAKILKNKRNQ